MMAPPVVVFRRLPEAIEVMAKDVVVAWLVVALSAVKLPSVEDALVRSPPVRVARLVTERVPVAVMFAAVRLPEKSALPTTDNSANGDVVPMPTFFSK